EFTLLVVDHDGAERAMLSPHTLASRLSYAVAGSPPDDILIAAAESGDIARDDEREAQARRLLDSPAGRAHVRNLFQRWLGLHGRYSPERAADLAEVEVDGLYDELREEALDFVEHVVFEERGGFRELMQSNLEFPKTERLAEILGEARSEGAVASSGHRAGLLTHPAVLISDNPRSSPIVRGVFVWERFLCDSFPPPPMDADDVAQENLDAIDSNESTSREIAETMTSPDRCQACHLKINAPGFAFSAFGPLGEEWLEEVVYAAPGVEHARLALEGDDQVTMVLDDETQTVDGAASLGERIAGSQDGRDCAALQLFRATHLRDPLGVDACHMSSLLDAMESNTPIFDILVMNAARESIYVAGDR
ncbi:MAG: DUF1592 domain-containing protein, partial [Myxococcota bacterium]